MAAVGPDTKIGGGNSYTNGISSTGHGWDKKPIPREEGSGQSANNGTFEPKRTPLPDGLTLPRVVTVGQPNK